MAGHPQAGAGRLAAALGTEEHTQAALGTEGCSTLPTCPALGPHTPSRVKVQLGGRWWVELGS